MSRTGVRGAKVDRLSGFIVFGSGKDIFLPATGNTGIIQSGLVNVAVVDIGSVTLLHDKFVQ